jgi:phosphoglycerol transferase
VSTQIDQLLGHRFRSEWKFWGIGALLSFFTASVLRSGWPEGLIPNITYPFIRGGDGAFSDWGVQRVIEGWIFNNARSGYPFGSSFYDYPGSDAGNYLALKILGMISGQFFIASNLFFLLSFPLILITSFAFLRAIKVNPWFSLSAAVLFTFFPFHFYRVGHLFYTWYFFVPIYFYCAFYFFYYQEKFSKSELAQYFGWSITLIISASFGVYYALFGVIVMLLGGIAGTISSRSYRNLLLSIGATASVTLGVALNVAPNLVHTYLDGGNPAVASRSPAEAEIYGFKLMHLVLPDASNKVASLAKVSADYYKYTLLNNENAGALMGSVGTLGLVLIAILIARRFFKDKVDDRLVLFSFIGLALFLFGTMGGLGSLFSFFISSSIRGWNRISIFIGLAAISVVYICIQNYLQQSRFFQKYLLIVFPVVAIALGGFGFYDQAHWPCTACNEASKADFKNEVQFIQDIEASLPTGAAVYQLPFMAFPEVPPLFRMGTYEHATGFTYSKNLLWNYGGMRGRPGEQFYRSLAREPASRQLEIISALGFSGVYIDRRGYADSGNQIIAAFTALLGQPTIVRKDGQVVFFKIQATGDTSVAKLTYPQILEKVGYYGNEIDFRYPAKFEDGIDFKKDGYPEFLKSVVGIDGRENWGRWSNANLWPVVKIEYNAPLPKKFKLVLQAVGFGANTNLPTQIKVGNSIQSVVLSDNSSKVYVLEFSNDEQAATIELIPAKPTAPREIDPALLDPRKLAIGLISLKVEPL